MKTSADGCEVNRFMNSPGGFERCLGISGRCREFGECEWNAEVVGVGNGEVMYVGGVDEENNG